MNDQHDLVGAYALDALDEAERAEFEAHLAQCASCRAEMSLLREMALHLSDADFEQPPAELRQRVLAAVATTPQDQIAEVVEIDTARRRRTYWWMGLAAGLILVALTGAVVAAVIRLDNRLDQAEQVAALLAAPDAEVIQLEGEEATMRLLTAGDTGMLIAEGLPEPPPGSVYEAWLFSGETPVPAGLFVPRDGMAAFRLEGDPSTATAVAVTLEPEGGSPLPTTTPLFVAPLEPAEE